MTSLTSRSGGLVQRKVATVQGADGGTEDRSREEDGYPEEEEDHDSKETRLTLLEEVLLLGLKDREVVISLIY